jgi:L-methionine (R)-S-oxide reductase
MTAQPTSEQIATSKTQLYKNLAEQVSSLIEGEEDFIANAANFSSLLFHSLPDLNWAGFYFLRDRQLVLGPFQGKPACVRIELGKGVCGTAAQLRQTVFVANVHEFPGHIACDSMSNSEIVVPVTKDENLLGVLDLDSPLIGRFDDEDARGLNELVALLTNSIWVESCNSESRLYTFKDSSPKLSTPNTKGSCADVVVRLWVALLFKREKMEATRVTVDEIKERMARGEQFTFVDTRNPKAWAEAKTKLPGAIRIPANEVEKYVEQIPEGQTVITYCTWPNEGSSASVAQRVIEQGIKNAHPLYGGFDAWEKAGLPVEPKEA